MAQAESGRSSLEDAILRVWTPAVGLQSIEELWLENLFRILEITDNSGETAPLLVTAFTAFVRNFVTDLEVYKSAFQTDVAKYFDNQGPFQLENALVSGSWSEGLFVYLELSTEFTPPDVDFMCVLKNIKFTTRDQLCGNLRVREDTPFVNAYITDEVCAKLWKDFFHESFGQHSSNKRQLSSSKLKEKLCQNYSNVGNNVQYPVHSKPDSADFTVDNGRPAEYTPIFNPDSIESFIDAICNKNPMKIFDVVHPQTFENFFYKVLPSSDIVLALSCDGWPFCANEWITRDRMWPDEDLVKKITQKGFHIVPKSSPEGDFRLSFSFAEITLIKHLSPLQHKLVRSFKGVVKYHQRSWGPNTKDMITTYHLKTIAFWYFEKTAQDSFSVDTVATHLILLLQELADAFRKQELPMYFMPKVNLLENVQNYEEAIDTVDKIIQLSRNYAAITPTVQKLSKFNLHTAIEDVMKDFSLLWENAKQTRNSDVENQKATPAFQCQFQSLMTIAFQLFSIQDDENQPSISHNDSRKILLDEYDSVFSNCMVSFLDELSSSVSRK